MDVSNNTPYFSTRENKLPLELIKPRLQLDDILKYVGVEVSEGFDEYKNNFSINNVLDLNGVLISYLLDCREEYMHDADIKNRIENIGAHIIKSNKAIRIGNANFIPLLLEHVIEEMKIEQVANVAKESITDLLLKKS